MALHRQTPGDSRQDDDAPGAYTLIVPGSDGRPRFERFVDAASYRARLMTLGPSNTRSLTIEEIAGLLDG